MNFKFILFFIVFIITISCKSELDKIEFKENVTMNFIDFDNADIYSEEEVIFKNYNLLKANFNIKDNKGCLFLIDVDGNNVFNDSIDVLFISPSNEEYPKNINLSNKLNSEHSRVFSINDFKFIVSNIKKIKEDFYHADIKELTNNNIEVPYQNRMLDKLPDISFETIENEAVSFKYFYDKNKLIYVEFWAIWCSPCISKLPEIRQLQNEYSDKIQIISIHSEKKVDKTQINYFIENHGVNWINGISNTEINNKINFNAVPKGFLFDSKGKLLIYDANPLLIKEYIKTNY